MKKYYIIIWAAIACLGILFSGCTEARKYDRAEKKVRDSFSKNNAQLLIVAEKMIEIVSDEATTSAKYTGEDLYVRYGEENYIAVTNQYPVLCGSVQELLESEKVTDRIWASSSYDLFDGPICVFSSTVYGGREIICTLELVYCPSGVATPGNEYIDASLEQLDVNWFLYREWRE